MIELLGLEPRDLYAMMAMQGFIQSGITAAPEEIAKASYRFADAMMQERVAGG